jgi:hypothetical protein
VTARPGNTPCRSMDQEEISSPEPSGEVDSRPRPRIFYTKKDARYYERVAARRRYERKRQLQSALIPVGQLIDPALFSLLKRRDGE